MNSLVVPASPECLYGKTMGRGTMAMRTVGGTNLIDYCQNHTRSEILDDVVELFERIGFHPTTHIRGLYLKNDGFWSCIWTVALGAEDTLRLRDFGIIIGLKKKHRLR
jgi:hypothetical protein